ncbi:MAG: carboxypeptidase regulatory-like domain-containing protein [Acidobacteria bacterium]|nr:carboxypeptidase regulatory-like domain-containing protein [Acidobacteriota bacterium]
MTTFSSSNFGVRRQRSFWLRCFLSASIVLLISGHASAQLDIPKPERLTHVEGVIVSPDGHPMPGIAVNLLRDEKISAETRTDQSGEFEFEKVRSGSYVFRVPRTQYAPAVRDIVITDEIVTHLERKKLYVILGPSACQDECSAVLTSKRDFDKALRRNRREH